ncbi:hypothetical protein [Anaeromyxobacter oryzae]|uniref:Uncharacterized protein n=1 Tax=Anaeromyxobacter oryzae TaxID=2918170 RepID=A0ABN6MM88_9BACT|nr:hypothetical protein [Anaeromyxobacter oryzae]BDG02168.1 hypothetical protein AMOR_11640 [Anaeromyxobacter oryzae]
MRNVVRRRRADGITELRPIDERLERPGWYLGAFTVLLFACALFVSTAIPPTLLAAVIAAALSGELCMTCRDLLDHRRPPAQIVVLARARAR